MFVILKLDGVDIELAILVDVEDKITKPIFELIHENHKFEFSFVEASFGVLDKQFRFLVGKLEKVLDFLIGRHAEDFLGVIVENADEFAKIIGMFPKSGSVVECLRDHRAFVGILVQFGLDDVEIAVTIDTDSVDRSAVRREFSHENKETDVFFELGKRNAFRILIDVLLKVVLSIKGRLLDRNGFLAVSGNDDGHSFLPWTDLDLSRLGKHKAPHQLGRLSPTHIRFQI